MHVLLVFILHVGCCGGGRKRGALATQSSDWLNILGLNSETMALLHVEGIRLLDFVTVHCIDYLLGRLPHKTLDLCLMTLDKMTTLNFDISWS